MKILPKIQDFVQLVLISPTKQPN